jgi:hypothetical protein
MEWNLIGVWFQVRDIPPNSELTIDYGDKWWKGKLDKFGGQFYCACDWPYCVRPAPSKPQISFNDAKLLAERVVYTHHRQYLAWKKKQKMVREAVASFNANNGVNVEEVQLPSLGQEDEEEGIDGDMESNGGSEDEGMEE